MTETRCDRCGSTFTNDARFCAGCGRQRASSDGFTPAIAATLAGKNGAYYARQMTELFPDGRVSLRPSWNWAAALVPFWSVQRGLFLPAIIWIVAALALNAVHPALCWAVPLTQGLFGNALYLMSLERKFRRQTASRALGAHA